MESQYFTVANWTPKTNSNKKCSESTIWREDGEKSNLKSTLGVKLLYWSQTFVLNEKFQYLILGLKIDYYKNSDK